MALALFSNEDANFTITYSPSGAPGTLRVTVADCSFLDFNAPNGARAFAAALCHCDWGTCWRNDVDAASQLAEYLPVSTSPSHANAADSAAVSEWSDPLASGAVPTSTAKERIANANFIGVTPSNTVMTYPLGPTEVRPRDRSNRLLGVSLSLQF
jgi:hypothetical protein